MSERPQGDIDCPHCHATQINQDVRVIVGNADGRIVAIRHTENCVDYEPAPARPDEEPT